VTRRVCGDIDSQPNAREAIGGETRLRPERH
jgi:hypothetical protein